MPYRWEKPDPDTLVLRVWPFRSLTPGGYVSFIGATAVLLAVPLATVFGSPALWALLPFLLAALAALMLALTRSNRRGGISEELVLTQQQARLLRRDPGREDRLWQANPYWIRVMLRADGPVADYLTLTGDNPREVELGAFLAPEERARLAGELREVLGRLKRPQAAH